MDLPAGRIKYRGIDMLCCVVDTESQLKLWVRMMEPSEEQVEKMAEEFTEYSAEENHHLGLTKYQATRIARYVLSLLLPAKEALETAKLWIDADPKGEVCKEIDAALTALKGAGIG